MDSFVTEHTGLLKGMGLTTAQCPFCGAGTARNSGKAFCISCESHIDFGKPDDLAGISRKMPAFYRDALLGKTEKLDGFAGEKRQQPLPPGVLYGIGVLYSHASSYAYHDRDYARMGFMEENSANVYASLSLTSKSKEFLYKALDSVERPGGSAGVEDAAYLKFIANVRLGRMTYAKRALGEIPAPDAALQQYSHMVYSVSTRSKDPMEYIDSMIRSGEPNALYYLARHLAQRRMFSDAVAVLQELISAWKSPMSEYLLRDLLEFMAKTSM